MGSKEVKRQERQQRQKQQQQKQLVVAAAIAAVVVGLIAVLIMVSQPDTIASLQLTPDTEGNLRIPKDSLAKNLNSITYGGTEELLVWNGGSGEIRTAFDTCMECYSGGNVNFIWKGSDITCNFCSSVQAVSVLGTAEWGGCKPVSITPEMREDTDTEVVIPAAALAYAEDMFSHWDAADFSFSFGTYGTDEAHTH